MPGATWQVSTAFVLAFYQLVQVTVPFQSMGCRHLQIPSAVLLPFPPYHSVAILDACGGPHLINIMFRGHIFISLRIAAALVAAGPGLKHLILECEPPGDYGSGDAAHVQRANDHVSGVNHLLEGRGPQLSSLDIIAADDWLPAAFGGLRHCTAVDTLNLSAGLDCPVGLSCKSL